MTYEVWGTPGGSGQTNLAAVAELHSRLEVLEKLVGQEALSVRVSFAFSVPLLMLFQQGEGDNIVGLVATLQKKVDQLDESHLEAVDRKMQSLILEMESVLRLSEKASSNPQEEKKVQAHVVRQHPLTQ